MDASSQALDSVQTLEVIFEAVLNKVEPADLNRQAASMFSPRGRASRARNARHAQQSSLPNRLQGLHVRPQPVHLKVSHITFKRSLATLLFHTKRCQLLPAQNLTAASKFLNFVQFPIPHFRIFYFGLCIAQ